MADRPIRRYRFGPLERRGVVGGLRSGQVAVCGLALVTGVVLLNVSRSPLAVLVALLIALGGAALAFYPLYGRTAEEWAPVTVAWAATGIGGQRRWRTRAPGAGARGELPGGTVSAPVSLPPEVGTLDLLAAHCTVRRSES